MVADMKLIVFLFYSYSSRDYNSRDSRDYGPPPRDYSYREYSNSSSRDDYGSMSRGYRFVDDLMQNFKRDQISVRMPINVISNNNILSF